MEVYTWSQGSVVIYWNSCLHHWRHSQEIKTSALFLSFENAMNFSCLSIPLAPLQVDAEFPDYIDRFPMFDTALVSVSICVLHMAAAINNHQVLEFAKGASYIFREIPLSKEPLQIQGDRSLQGSRRPQSVHQVKLISFQFPLTTWILG